MKRLQGKTAIVTGAGKGIGKAIAQQFAREGARTVIADVDESTGGQAASEICGTGGEAVFVRCDVTREEDISALMSSVRKAYTSPDILVNNAGIPGAVKPVTELTLEEWMQSVKVNLNSVFLCCKYAVPEMADHGGGVIINLASVSGKRPMPHRSPYTTTKMGVIGFTRTLAAEVGKWNIRVNSICPGSVIGERQDIVFTGIMESTGMTVDEVKKMKAESSALKRFVDPFEVANVAVFLASDEAAAITGQDINVCAGAVMY